MSQEKRGPYQKSAKLRARAVQAATRMFSENGYHATSMREIAAELGISHTGLKHHFPSKEALLTAVLQHRDEVDNAAIAEEIASGHDHLTALLHLTQRNARRRPIIELFTTLAAEATTPGHPAHDYFIARYAQVTANLIELFDSLARAGRLRPGVDPAHAARVLVAVMDGLQVQWLYRTSECVDNARDQMLDDLRGYLHLVLVEDADATS